MFRRIIVAAAFAAALGTSACTGVLDTNTRAGDDAQAPKLVIISMFGPEGDVWLNHLGPWRDILVPGLSPDYPTVHCNREGV